MPSVLLTGQSGGMPLISGSLGSGITAVPRTGVQVMAWPSNSGLIYVGLSGNLTVTSGSYPLSGGGGMDGLPLAPGAGCFFPRGVFSNASGSPPNIYVACDPACSGVGRVGWEAF